MKISLKEKKMIEKRRFVTAVKKAKVDPTTKKQAEMWEDRHQNWTRILGNSKSVSDRLRNASDDGHLLGIINAFKKLGDKDKVADLKEELKAIKTLEKKMQKMIKLAIKQKDICWKNMMKLAKKMIPRRDH